MQVNIQEIINPKILPKAKKLRVINTKSGSTGTMDSIKIKKHPTIGPQTPIPCSVVSINVSIASNIINHITIIIHLK